MIEALIGGLAAGVLILLVQNYQEWRKAKLEQEGSRFVVRKTHRQENESADSN